jgi:hypothetical protein
MYRQGAQEGEHTHSRNIICPIVFNLTVIWDSPSDGHLHNNLFHIQGGDFPLNTSIIYKWTSETQLAAGL